MNRFGLASLCLLGVVLVPSVASATKSAELYTGTAYGYGRFETRMRVAAGDGIVSAFFLWKDGSEKEDTFWNELDYEKVGASCQLETNALYGNPEVNHNKVATVSGDICGGFHVYGYEWTADYVAWFLDGMEIRRETGETAAAYAQNASAGMQIHFNLWPGDASFGGNFNPSSLPVHQYMDWVQFSSYANGAFTLAWREDFNAATAPTGWASGDWGSPKNLSTHEPLNVNFVNGCAVISMTADDATGPAGVDASGCTLGMGGAAGMGTTGGAAGMSAGGAGASTGGAPSTGGAGNAAGAGAATSAGGASASGAGGDSTGSSGAPALGGSSGTTAATGGANAGGASGSTGSGAAAGVPSTGATGGTTSSGGAGPTGGNPASGGATTAGGEAAGQGHGADGSDSDGCGCRVPRSTQSSQRESGVGTALLLVLAGALRRRRTSRVPPC